MATNIWKKLKQKTTPLKLTSHLKKTPIRDNGSQTRDLNQVEATLT